MLRLVRLLVLLSLLALAPAPAAPAAPQRPRTLADDWLGFGHDGQLTNFVRSDSIDARSARGLGVLWSTKLDGAVIAQPLIARVYSQALVLAATMGGSVYAVDAVTGRVEWQRSFGTVATPGCGTYGFSSTGTVDLARGLLYVAGSDGLVHALSLQTGAEASGWPVRVVRRTMYTYVWGGLRIVGSRLYVPIASYCDELDPRGLAAEGRIVSIDLGDPASRTSFDPVPGWGNLGGDWAWGGISVEPDGSFLYAGIGNAEQRNDAGGLDEVAGYADTVVKLTPDLQVVDWNRPYTPTGYEDEDLGGTPVLFQPPGCPPLAAANSKIGTLFIWRRDDLARGPLQAVPLSDGVDAFVGEPSWSQRTGMLYDAGATFERGGARLGTGVMALRIGAGCTADPAWSAVVGDGPQPPPLIVGDVVVAAGGQTGGYEAHDAATGVLLWKLATPGVSTLGSPSAGYGTIFAGDGGGTLRAFAPRPRSLR